MGQLITWTDELSVNVHKFDLQHKRIVLLINKLHAAMAGVEGNEVQGDILNCLVDYVKTHFADEEKELRKQGYPNFARQKIEHETLTKQVITLHNDFNSGKNISAGKLMQFLKSWLREHIMEEDMKYSTYLNSKGVC